MDENPKTNDGAKPSRLAITAAFIVVAGFAALCFAMIRAAMTVSPEQWDHLVVVFNSVQAMAAAALGVLLGTTVQQARVDAANGRAALAETKRAAAEEDQLKAKVARTLVDSALTNQNLRGDRQEPGDASLRAMAAALP
jgi:hypothetical protein